MNCRSAATTMVRPASSIVRPMPYSPLHATALRRPLQQLDGPCAFQIDDRHTGVCSPSHDCEANDNMGISLRCLGDQHRGDGIVNTHPHMMHLGPSCTECTECPSSTISGWPRGQEYSDVSSPEAIGGSTLSLLLGVDLAQLHAASPSPTASR